jgi:hypothetical protein
MGEIPLSGKAIIRLGPRQTSAAGAVIQVTYALFPR